MVCVYFTSLRREKIHQLEGNGDVKPAPGVAVGLLILGEGDGEGLGVRDGVGEADGITDGDGDESAAVGNRSAGVAEIVEVTSAVSTAAEGAFRSGAGLTSAIN